MNFDFQNIQSATLYGYFEDAQGQNIRHVQVPVDPGVQKELIAMLSRTAVTLGLPANAHNMETFDPGQKYSSEEKLKISLRTSYLQELAAVVALRNLPSDPNALALIAEMEYYYSVFVDTTGRLLYAFRRASQFKGVTKSKLAMVNGGVLTLLSTSVFRLDNDFDYLVANNEVYILRPSGFEYTTKAQTQILSAAATNAQAIATAIAYLDVSTISAYASTHIRSARLLAAIGSRNDLNQIDRALLMNACSDYSINVSNLPNGKISPNPGNEYNFLCILDRRAYISTLIPNQPEKYEAASRIKK